jgi:hypothetical protein
MNIVFFLGSGLGKDESGITLFSRLHKKNHSSSSNDEMIDSSIVDC